MGWGVVAHVIIVSALGPNPSFFFFWGTFIQLGGLLGQGPGLGLGPGLDDNKHIFHSFHIRVVARSTFELTKTGVVIMRSLDEDQEPSVSFLFSSLAAALKDKKVMIIFMWQFQRQNSWLLGLPIQL